MIRSIRSLADAARNSAAPSCVRTTSDGDAFLVRSAPILSEAIGGFVWSVWAALDSDAVLVETRSEAVGGPCGLVSCDPDEADDAMAESAHLAGLAR